MTRALQTEATAMAARITQGRALAFLSRPSPLRRDARSRPAAAGTAAWQSPLAVAVLLALFAILVCARMPAVLIKGRFWAEEGRNFFAAARTLPPLEALLHSYGGYLNLVANAATLLAHLALPMLWAPYLTIAVGLLFQLLPPLLLLTARDAWLRPRPNRLAACLLILLMPGSEEVSLQCLHCQFELTLCCGIVLSLEPVRGIARAGRLSLLLLAPLCGPGAIVLVPLFLARALADRSPGRLGEALTLAAGSAVQLALFTERFAGRSYGFDPLVLLLVVTVRHLALPFLGPAVARTVATRLRLEMLAGHAPLVALALPLLVFLPVLALAWRRARSTPALWLLAAAGLTAATSYYGMIGGAAYLINNPHFGERYVFVPQALLLVALLALVATLRRRAAVAGWAVIAWLLVVGAATYRTTWTEISDGPAWRDEVRAWQHDPSHVIRLWPDQWSVNYAR